MNALSRNRHLGAWMTLVVLLVTSPVVMADLMLFPTRVVFDKSQRATQVELVNQGKTPETYRISLVNRRMGETGDFVAVDKPGPGENFADAMLRFSPRQVTIPPGASQTVRIMLNKPADLAPGEYRSHLQFDRVADANATNSIEKLGNPDNTKVGVVLSALVGASIPVIIRQGDTQATVSLSDVVVLPPAAGETGSVLSFLIHREGNRSTYGDLAATFTPKSGGTPIELAKAGGVAVYASNPLRRARMPMQMPEGLILRGGTVHVVYRERADAGGKVMAESSVTLP
jgi:fimbrial chaperone protein